MSLANRSAPKVCHITSAHPIFDIRIFIKECVSLAQAGYEVTLLAPDDGSVASRSSHNGVQILTIHRPASRWSRFTSGQRDLLRLAKQVDADVYHFHDPDLGLVGLLLARMGKTVIYDIHEDYPRSFLSSSRDYIPPSARKIVSRLFERLENWATARYAAAVTATPAIGERFSTINAQTVVVNNYPIAKELVSSNGQAWDERPANVVYAGSISFERGLGEMVEAMSRVPGHLGAKLLLAGGLPDSTECSVLTRSPGWQHIEALGLLPRQELPDLLNKARAGLVVYHPMPNHINAQPNKLFEYLSAGIPIIASDFPLWRKLIDNVGCGLLVDPLDPQAIAAAIEYLLTHPAEAEAMGKRGQRAVEETYSWAAEETKLLGLYSKLTQND